MRKASNLNKKYKFFETIQLNQGANSNSLDKLVAQKVQEGAERGEGEVILQRLGYTGDARTSEITMPTLIQDYQS